MSEQTCGCGCGQPVLANNRMELVRSTWTSGGISRPGRQAWWVRRDCRPAFEDELLRIHAVEEVVRTNASAGLLRRLAVAAQVYDLQRDIHQRRRGPQVAAGIARRAAVRFVAPRWEWLQKRLPRILPLDSPQQVSEKEAQ